MWAAHVQQVVIILCVCCLLDSVFVHVVNGVKAYDYKFYSYRKKQRNERKIKSLRAQCLATAECEGLPEASLESISCVRKCMSPSCYQELYAQDELEQGEIDVRYNSFKGCIIWNNK